MIMLNSCALNRPWDVKEALGVWKKRLRAQQRMRPEESRKGESVGFCVVCQRDLVAQLDGEGCSRELCVRMRRILSRKTSVFNGSVSRGELEDDIELNQRCRCETYE